MSNTDRHEILRWLKRWEQRTHFCLHLMETLTSSQRRSSRWIIMFCNERSAGGRLDETEQRCRSCLRKNPPDRERLHAVVSKLKKDIFETQFHCVIGQVPEVWVCHRTLASEGNRTHAWLCSLQVEIILKRSSLSWPWPSARDVSLCSEPRQWWTRMWCTPTPLLPASRSTLSSTTRLP